jgi:hypothetical protein
MNFIINLYLIFLISVCKFNTTRISVYKFDPIIFFNLTGRIAANFEPLMARFCKMSGCG